MIKCPEMASLKIKGVAELMGVSVSTIKRWIRYHGFPCYRLPGGLGFSPAEILAWQRKRQNVQVEEPEVMTPEKAVRIVENVR